MPNMELWNFFLHIYTTHHLFIVRAEVLRQALHNNTFQVWCIIYCDFMSEFNLSAVCMKKALETNLHLGSVWCIECGIFPRLAMNSSIIKPLLAEYQTRGGRVQDGGSRFIRHTCICFIGCSSRVTLVVAFGFLPQTFGKVVVTYDWYFVILWM